MCACTYIVIILSDGNTQFGAAHDKYSCGIPLIEVAERLARLLFFVSVTLHACLAAVINIT